MPKDTTEHIQRNQKQRIRIREKSQFYSPGTVNLQVRKINEINFADCETNLISGLGKWRAR
jgi:hypothetical protein